MSINAERLNPYIGNSGRHINSKNQDSIPDDLQHYLNANYGKATRIYGKAKKFNTYGGSAFVTFDNNITYKLNFSRYRMPTVVEDEAIEIDNFYYDLAKKAFENQEGRVPNMNNLKECNAVAILEAGIRFAFNL